MTDNGVKINGLEECRFEIDASTEPVLSLIALRPKGDASVTLGDLEHDIHENIIQQQVDPAVIAAEVARLLETLNHSDVFVVRRLAKNIATAIAWELAFKDGDMVEVIQKLGAVLNSAITWLRRYDVRMTRGSFESRATPFEGL
jgi:hypothetical protein